MIAPKIVITHYPYVKTLKFSVTCQLSRVATQKFSRPVERISDKRLSSVGPVGKKLVTDVLSIMGVINVHLDTYALEVTIGEAFSWDEGIEEEVIAALKVTFSQCDVDEIKISHISHDALVDRKVVEEVVDEE